ncbi:MAG TPA: glycosyltransferase family 4 protein [Edaphocola sp.]|nr:glycosyltransferase family 4 protein [Edaphocola sp.]
MKVLMLGNRIPFPLNDGGNLAVSNMIEGLLTENIKLSLLLMNTSRHWVDENNLPPIFKNVAALKLVPVDNRIKPLDALYHFIKKNSYNLARFKTDIFEEALIEILKKEKYDLIILEGLYVTPYLNIIRKHTNTLICYRQHNVEFQIWERLAHNTQNKFKKFYYKKLAVALKKYEIEMCNQYDCIAAISPIDAAYYKKLGCNLPILNIPYGLKSEQLPTKQADFTAPLKLYHIGAMDWLPNIKAINWFLKKVWPLILEKAADTTLYLAGRNMPDSFKTGKWKNVFVLGEVPDAKEFESDKHILIVPLNSGGGLRIKILESMAAGKAVISTSIGIQGMDPTISENEVIIADNIEAFANACLNLLSNPKLAKELGNNAKIFIENKYSQSVVIKKLLEEIKKINLERKEQNKI